MFQSLGMETLIGLFVIFIYLNFVRFFFSIILILCFNHKGFNSKFNFSLFSLINQCTMFVLNIVRYTISKFTTSLLVQYNTFLTIYNNYYFLVCF